MSTKKLFVCDECKKSILTVRWSCVMCKSGSEYDLCDACYKRGPPYKFPHPPEHKLKPFRGNDEEDEIHSNIINISSMSELKQAAKDTNYKLMVCNFFASWFKPAVQFFPLFSRMSLAYPEARFLRVDIDVAKEVATHYNLNAPAIKIFQKGKKTIDFAGVNAFSNPLELESIIGFELVRSGLKKVDPPPEQPKKTNNDQQTTSTTTTTTTSVGSSEHKDKHFPAQQYLFWDSVGQIDKILAKLFEFSNELDADKKLFESEKECIISLGDTLNKKQSSVSTEQVAVLSKILKSWPVDKVFPAVDLLRLVLVHPSDAPSLKILPVFDHLLHSLRSSEKSTENTKLLTLRALSNYFYGERKDLQNLGGGTPLFVQSLAFFVSDKKSHQVALSYLLWNYSIALRSLKDTTDRDIVLDFLEQLLQTPQDEESLYRLLVCVGTLLKKNNVHLRLNNILPSVQKHLNTIQQSIRIGQILSDLKKQLNK